MKVLTPVEKWTYAIGNIPYSVKDTAFGSFVVFYYTQVLGLSGTLAGLAMFIALTWDAISDPLVGSWSDRLRTRWGRRHPLLVLGAIPTALLFLVVFPPDLGFRQLGIFLWLVVASIALRTALTIYYIPFSAMGAELSPDYDERTVIAKARITMGWLSAVCVSAVAYALVFTTRGDTDGRLVAENYATFGVMCAVLTAVAACICIVGTRTVIPRLPQSEGGQAKFGPGAVFSDVGIAWKSRNFRLAFGSTLSFGVAMGVYATMSLYLGTYFWEFSSEQLAILIAPAVVATVVCFVALNSLGRRFDKPRLMAFASGLLALSVAWMICARLLGILPPNGHVVIFPLMMVTAFFGVFATIVSQTVGVSLLADILDEQELATGYRQEGVFFAANAFALKATTGAGALVAGIIIDLAGVAQGSEPGTIDQGVLNALGGFSAIAMGLFCGIAFEMNRRIDLGRGELGRVQAKLKAGNKAR